MLHAGSFFRALMIVSNGSCACDSKPGRSLLPLGFPSRGDPAGLFDTLLVRFTARTPLHRTSHFTMDEASSSAES